MDREMPSHLLAKRLAEATKHRRGAWGAVYRIFQDRKPLRVDKRALAALAGYRGAAVEVQGGRLIFTRQIGTTTRTTTERWIFDLWDLQIALAQKAPHLLPAEGKL